MAHSEESTVIGESILVSGNVQGDDDLVVRGRIEGTVTVSKALVIEASGVVKAEVQAQSCVISGALVGNLVASEGVEITKEGRMVGDISAPRVVIVDGATFQGRIDMGELDLEEGERPERAERPALVARAPARPQLRAPPPRQPGMSPRGSASAEQSVGRAERARDDGDEGEEGGPSRPPAPPVPVGMGSVKRKVIVRRK